VLPAIANADALLEKYASLREIRTAVQKELEALRVSGAIGSSLQADVTIHANGEQLALLQNLGDDLKFVLITSAAQVIPAASADEAKIQVTASSHKKCERCWHYRADVGEHAAHASLCGRCVSNLFGQGEQRHAA
jgi:isoleucyl-tRNA synthetase